MESKLISIPECVRYVDAVVSAGEVEFCFLSDAPFLVKLISRGSYLACGKTVYVPMEHFKMATSTNESDRTVATAKLLPWVMAIRDGHLTTIIDTWKFLHSYKLQAKYFVYEYGFLKASDNTFAEMILAGFIGSRKSFLGFKKIPPETVIDYMRLFLQ